MDLFILKRLRNLAPRVPRVRKENAERASRKVLSAMIDLIDMGASNIKIMIMLRKCDHIVKTKNTISNISILKANIIYMSYIQEYNGCNHFWC